MFDIEATHARELDGPDRWLAEARGGEGLGQPYERHDQAKGSTGELLARARAQLAEDRGANPAGAFTKLRMTLAPEWHEAVRGVDSEAAARRMLEAAKRAIASQLPRHQGVLTLVRQGPDSIPAVQAVLSPRLRDGGTAPLLGRADIARLEAKWDRTVQVAFGLTRNLESGRRPDAPHEHELRTEMDRAMRRFMDVMSARMRGEASQEDLRGAATEAERATEAYRSAQLRPEPRPSVEKPTPELVRHSDVSRRGVEGPPKTAPNVLRFRIKDGHHYLHRWDPQDVRTVLQRATEAAIGRAGLQVKVETVCRNAGRDLQVFVLFNRRAENAGREVDPNEVSTALLTHLRAEIPDKARQYDSRLAGTVGELGKVDLVRTGREPLLTDRPSRAPGAALPSPAIAESFEVRLRLTRGVEYLAAVPPENRRDVIWAAVERAFPFLVEQRSATHFAVLSDGNALHVRVTVPTRFGWTRQQLERPLFQFRFAHEIQRAFVVYGGGRKPLSPLPASRPVGGLLRTLGRGVRGAVDVGRVVQSPARTLAESAVFSRIPSPLRTIMAISRALGFLRQPDE
jgi:hypothetical protein